MESEVSSDVVKGLLDVVSKRAIDVVKAMDPMFSVFSLMCDDP